MNFRTQERLNTMNLAIKAGQAKVLLDTFKRIIFDDTPADIEFYERFLGEDFANMFEEMEDRSFSMSLSGKWKESLVFMELKLVEGMPKMVLLNINGKEVMTTLHKHPLAEHFS